MAAGAGFAVAGAINPLCTRRRIHFAAIVPFAHGAAVRAIYRYVVFFNKLFKFFAAFWAFVLKYRHLFFLPVFPLFLLSCALCGTRFKQHNGYA